MRRSTIDIIFGFVLCLFAVVMVFYLPSLLVSVSVHSQALGRSFNIAFFEILNSGIGMVLIALVSLTLALNLFRLFYKMFEENFSDRPENNSAAVDQKKIFTEKDCKK